MPPFVNMTDVNAHYCLECPGCHRRYCLWMVAVAPHEQEVVIDYLCSRCHACSSLTITEANITWTAKPSRAREESIETGETEREKER